MAHHMAGKFTVHDLRTREQRYAKSFVYNSPPDGVFDRAGARYVAEELVKQGFQPRVDFAVVEWLNVSSSDAQVVGHSAGFIHDRAETLWQERKPKLVVELWSGSLNTGYRLFGWLGVRRSVYNAADCETRVVFKRNDATLFDNLTPEQIAEWHKSLGAPDHVKLVVREAVA